MPWLWNGCRRNRCRGVVWPDRGYPGRCNRFTTGALRPSHMRSTLRDLRSKHSGSSMAIQHSPSLPGRVLFPAVIAHLGNGPTTLVHGYFRAGNLFLDRESSTRSVIAIDWQLAMRCRGAFDVAYLLGTSLRPSDRRVAGLPSSGRSGQPRTRASATHHDTQRETALRASDRRVPQRPRPGAGDHPIQPASDSLRSIA